MEFNVIANVLCLQHDIVIPNTKTQCKISSLHERKNWLRWWTQWRSTSRRFKNSSKRSKVSCQLCRSFMIEVIKTSGQRYFGSCGIPLEYWFGVLLGYRNTKIPKQNLLITKKHKRTLRIQFSKLRKISKFSKISENLTFFQSWMLSIALIYSLGSIEKDQKTKIELPDCQKNTGERPECNLANRKKNRKYRYFQDFVMVECYR